jgi:polar amino acid transport system substrate-binding protein
MLSKNLIKALLVLLLSFLPMVSAVAQDTIEVAPKQKVRLGVRKIDPFVMNKDNKYTGFSVDLWDQLAKDSNIETTEIKEYPNVNDLLKAVEKKEVDAAIAAISITAEREKVVDFTTPMYNSGLSIMTKTTAKQSSVVEIFNQIKKAVFNNDFAALTLILTAVSFILANLLYFIEKRKNDGFLDSTNYFSGISLSFWWGVTALFGQQDRHPGTKLGRFIGVLWMIFGVLFLSFFTAQITSNLTADKITGNVNNIKDLKGQKIATVYKSTAQAYLVNNEYIQLPKEQQDQNPYLKMTLAEAGELLISGEVAAVVYDGPALDYYVKSKGNGELQTIGGLFTAENYGIALPAGSNLRKTLNLNLLKVQENGTYNDLKTKYFGE